MTSPSPEDVALIEAWCAWYRAGSKSPGTIKLRRSHLLRLARAFALLDVDEDDLIGWLDGHDIAPSSRKSLMASVKSFYIWAVRTRRLDEDPTTGLQSVTAPEGLPKPISEAALEGALAAADAETTLMLLLGAYAGLRRAEIAQVHSSHVTDLGLIVKGKGGKTRRISLHARLVEPLSRIDGWAFPSPVRPEQHVTPDYISTHLDSVLPSPYTPHSLRHRFATQMYRACKDIRMVQQLLGHSSIQTTVRYVMVDEDALSAAVNAIA